MEQQEQPTFQQQMSEEEIKRTMPDVYRQIRQTRAQKAARVDSLSALEKQREMCLEDMGRLEAQAAILKERAAQLESLISTVKASPEIQAFFDRFDNLPNPSTL